MPEEIKNEVLEEVINEVIEEISDEESDTPEIELTEEEAEKAAKGVSQLLRFMKMNRPLKERQQEKVEKYKLQKAELPEGHYKIAQIENKIALLEKKINPVVIWESSKGTYVKEKQKQ